MDVDVKSEIGVAAQRRSEQATTAAALQVLVQCRQQIGVLATQVDQTLARPDRYAGDAHAIEQQVGIAREQDAILEGPRFALVGVADHVTRRGFMAAGRPACRLPFDVRGKPRAAAAAQVGDLHFRQHRIGTACNGRLQCFSRWRLGSQHRVAAPDVVFDDKILARPVGQRGLRPDQFADTVDPFGRHAGQRLAIDQQRRPLIAHAGAGRRIDADQPVFGDLATFDPQPVAQAIHQLDAAQHAVGDVVREQHAVAPNGGQMKKRVKACNAFDARARQIERPRDDRQRGGRQIAQGILHRAQDLEQKAGVTTMTVDDRQQQGLKPSCFNALVRHHDLPLLKAVSDTLYRSLVRRSGRVLIQVNGKWESHAVETPGGVPPTFRSHPGSSTRSPTISWCIAA
ncbi:hypothetical protein ACCAA_260010 [Candidatus Accumulibacter aalborgensis]|uniref:Uncharacterized protein n=1 Tax=Candidatus Accumulibacter aalborgensis TaxID=1860102 RepID=A0A1A8XMI5_9PROT|nr:hypothetical protein ACCAA_260010 [Candidatus Accumulibacter aalborgensis]